jgi:hypothetical protein
MPQKRGDGGRKWNENEKKSDEKTRDEVMGRKMRKTAMKIDLRFQSFNGKVSERNLHSLIDVTRYNLTSKFPKEPLTSKSVSSFINKTHQLHLIVNFTIKI